MTNWTTKHGCDTLIVNGRYHVIVWEVAGAMVCSAYIPLGDHEYEDGRMLVGHRTLETKDRATARDVALRLAVHAFKNLK